MKFDLSVLIPARNEMWLQNTIDDVLKNSCDTTEVIVVCDGTLPHQSIPTHPRVTVALLPKSIGQRAATNMAARMSRAEFIMKLDAHCAVSKHFDKKLIEVARKLEPGVLQVPRQYNLHVFDWVCKECGYRRYQGRKEPCRNCKKDATERELVWHRRGSRLTTCWRFDTTLHFQYWGARQRMEEGQPDKIGVSETMSLLGACWFVSREQFWAFDGLDEGHGGWGQMGTELACKWWMGGSRVVTNHRPWFAHLFRTQGGDFGFPYPIKGSQQAAARKYSQDLWRNGKWPKAKHDLKWMIERFNPPGWGEEVQKLKGGEANSGVPGDDKTPPAPEVRKGVVYYTDCRGDETILNSVRVRLGHAVNGHQIVSVGLDDTHFGAVRIILANEERGQLTMFRQILAGLVASDADVVFLCEHDVLYPEEHFQFTPPKKDVIYYNENVWKVDAKTGRALHYRCRQTSGLCAWRETLVEHYQKRVALVREKGYSTKMGYEPGTHGRPERVDDLKSEGWMSERPLVDIRHDHNLSPTRWKKEEFRNQRFTEGWTEADEVPGWGRTKDRFYQFLREVL